MKIPAIRAALELLAMRPGHNRLSGALVRVGLRACDEWESAEGKSGPEEEVRVTAQAGVIADILREAGVEVEG